MGRTLHERVPLKGKYGFTSAGSTLAWMGLAIAIALLATAFHALK